MNPRPPGQPAEPSQKVGRAGAEAEVYQALLRTNLDGYVMIASSGAVLDANGEYLRMTGYSLEEVLRLNIADLDALETRAETDQHSARIMSEGSDRFLSRHRRKDGSTFPVEVSTTYVPKQDLMVGFVRDLTELTAAEAAQRESDTHHRELVEILGEGVSIVDSNETFVMANPAAEQMFGVGRHQLVGRNLHEFLEESEWQKVTEQTAHRLSGQTNSYLLRIRRPDGERRVLQVTVTPRRNEAGDISGSLGVSRDLTDDIKSQEALRLSQKMESLGNLAGGLAHDMNNVLGAILGLASTHLDLQPEGTPIRAALETITKACERGRNTVKSLLDFARKDVAWERQVTLNNLVKEEARLLERIIPANITIWLHLDPDVGTILGDPDALNLVLMNLCVNAMDAMPEGGRLSLGTRKLAGGMVLVTVEDTGMGMTPETLEQAVDPFFTTKPQGKGTGLGLSLAFSTVKAHRGQMEIRSTPGKGTIIDIRLPEVEKPAEPAAPPPPGPPASIELLEVLLVDDDDLVRAAVAAQLEAMGHQTVLAATGEEAMRLVSNGLRPEVIILDLNMPGWGGARTLPKLRAALPDVPILLSTGRADQQAIDLTKAHPRVTILAKPYGFRELRSTLAALRPRA